ncbi:ABC transporter substrate-binding protein [Curvivirga aplysinae]|uniref:ABC transporter substrate-binding protein n=1 Tax=Curvivirga aplysinae TaxID=2529852 RepID=UPI001C3F58D5|nr:ABC transporter substrate-binding protein [Curvivirga aplysinae]
MSINNFNVRRDLLKKIACVSSVPLAPFVLTGHKSRAASPSPRIISLDYGVATTLIALGNFPVGIASADHWDRWVQEPALPDTVADIGHDLVVNKEVIAALQPDLVFLTPYTMAHQDALRRITDVEIISVYQEGTQPMDRSFIETQRIADIIGAPEKGAAYIAKVKAKLDAARQLVDKLSLPPITMVNFMDARHVRVFGTNSLYQNVIDFIGLENGWKGETNYWGFRTIGLEDLAISSQGDMDLIVFEPVVEDIRPTLANSPLWKDLPVVKQNRMTILPAVLMFGMLPSIERFIDIVLGHLEAKYK